MAKPKTKRAPKKDRAPAETTVAERGLATRFQPGNPGRPKGSRNKLGEDFLRALHEDFTAHGVEAIQACRSEDPVQYVKVLASILPKELNVNLDPLDEMTDDELIDRIRQLDVAVNAALGGTGAPEGNIAEAGDSAKLHGLRPH